MHRRRWGQRRGCGVHAGREQKSRQCRRADDAEERSPERVQQCHLRGAVSAIHGVSQARPDTPEAIGYATRLHLAIGTIGSGSASALWACGTQAQPVPDWPYPDGADFVVLRDTEGNLFCVINHD